MALRESPSLSPILLCTRLLAPTEEVEGVTGWPLPGEVLKGLMKGVVTRVIDVSDEGERVFTESLFIGLAIL